MSLTVIVTSLLLLNPNIYTTDNPEEKSNIIRFAYRMLKPTKVGNAERETPCPIADNPYKENEDE